MSPCTRTVSTFACPICMTCFTVGVAVGDGERFAVAARDDELRAGERDSLAWFPSVQSENHFVFHAKARFAWGRARHGGEPAVLFAPQPANSVSALPDTRPSSAAALSLSASLFHRVFHASSSCFFPPNVMPSKAWRAVPGFLNVKFIQGITFIFCATRPEKEAAHLRAKVSHPGACSLMMRPRAGRMSGRFGPLAPVE